MANYFLQDDGSLTKTKNKQTGTNYILQKDGTLKSSITPVKVSSNSLNDSAITSNKKTSEFALKSNLKESQNKLNESTSNLLNARQNLNKEALKLKGINGYLPTKEEKKQSSAITLNNNTGNIKNILERNNNLDATNRAKEIISTAYDVNKTDEVKKAENEYIQNLSERNKNQYLLNQYKVENTDPTVYDKTLGRALSGAKSVFSGFTNKSKQKIIDEDGKVKYLDSYSDMWNKKVSDSYENGFTKFAGDVLYEGSRIGASSLLNAIIPGMGTGSYWTSMYSNSYYDAKKDGHSDASSAAFATLDTASEFLVGRLLGSATKNLTGGKTSELSSAIKRAVKKIINNDTISSFIANATSEGTEEFLQEYIQNVNKLITLDHSTNINDYINSITSKETLENALYSAAVGAVTGSVFGGKVEDEVNNVKVDNNINNSLNNAEINNLSNNNYVNSNINNNVNNNVNTNINNNVNNNVNTNISNSLYTYVPSENEKINNLKQSAVNTGLNNSTETNDLINTISKVIEDKDYNIIFDNNLKDNNGNEASGRITTLNNGEVEIRINPMSDKAGEFILAHEISHAIKTQEMVDYINKYASTHEDFNNSVRNIINRYGKDLTDEEVFADVCGQLFGNQEFINSLQNENTIESKNLIKQIYEAIKRLLNSITEKGRYRNFVKDLELKWRDAYQTQNNNLNGNTNYSTIGAIGAKNLQKNSNSRRYRNLYTLLQTAKEIANESKENLENTNILTKRATQWYQTKYGDWGTLISDKDSKITKQLEPNHTYRLGDIFKHDLLYKAYPGLENIKVKTVDNIKAKGIFRKLKYIPTNTITDKILINNDNLNTLNYRKTLLHEINHFIEGYEKFNKNSKGVNSSGVNIEEYANNLGEIISNETKILADLTQEQLDNIILPKQAKENPKYSDIRNALLLSNKIDREGGNIGDNRLASKDTRKNQNEMAKEPHRQNDSENRLNNFYEDIEELTSERINQLAKNDVRNTLKLSNELNRRENNVNKISSNLLYDQEKVVKKINNINSRYNRIEDIEELDNSSFNLPKVTNDLNEYAADVLSRQTQQSIANKESVKQSILDYLEENNITNPTKSDMMNAFDWYEESDAANEFEDVSKAEKLYSEVADELLEKNNKDQIQSNQIKNVNNTNPTNSSDIRYSTKNEEWEEFLDKNFKSNGKKTYFKDIRTKDNDILKYTSKRLQSNLEKMKELKIENEAFGLNEKDSKLYNNLLKRYDKNYAVSEKAKVQSKKGILDSLKESKSQLGLTNKQNQDFKEVLSKYIGLTRDQLSSKNAYEDIKNTVSSYADRKISSTNYEIKQVKDIIRNIKIKVDDAIKNDITDYNDFRKNNFGKLRLSNEGTSVYNVYSQLSDQYPQHFDKDVINETDMLNEISNFMNKEDKSYENYNLSDEQILDITDSIYNKLKKNLLHNEEIKDIEKQIDKNLIAAQRRSKVVQYRQLANKYIENNIEWKDTPLAKQKINTMKRNLRDIMPKTDADNIYNEYFYPITENNAKIEKTKTKYNSKISKLNLNKNESTAVQMLGELKYNPDTKLSSTEVYDFIKNNKLDNKKIENAVEVFRNVYDDLFSKVNSVLREQGYKEIEYRKGYFPHFTEEHGKTIIGKMAEKLGWKFNSNKLSTDIAGKTELFLPGKNWVTFSQRRTGDVTDYNALKGFDNYLDGAMKIIYHTEDIQKLRALENEIRYQHSEKGLQEKIDQIYNSDKYFEDKENELDTLFKEYNNELANFVTNLRDYTNNLAGKKSFLDRSTEQLIERKVYNTMENISRRVSANMVGANISSAFTNFIPMTQAWSQISTPNMFKAMAQTISNQNKTDNFVDKSVYLTNRINKAEKLYKTGLEKVSDKAGIVFEAIDEFTSETIVRGKYLENIKNGMDESQAIKNADEFAKDVMAGRSQGDSPTIFNAKNPVTKLFTAFQLEVNNQYGYMFKDLPNDFKDKATKSLIKAFLKMFLGAWIYNKIAESITGRKSAFSPIDIVEETTNVVSNDKLSSYDKISKVSKNLAEELPYLGGLLGGGRLPISSALPSLSTTVKAATNLKDEAKRKNAINDLKKELSKPVYYIVLPFGGGQLKKTKEGIKMYSKDNPVAGSYTSTGKLRFAVGNDILSKTQAAVFGQYSSKNARDYFDNNYSALTDKQIKELKDTGIDYKEYREYRNILSTKTKVEDKIKYIAGTDFTDKQKNILANNAVTRNKKIDLSNYNDFSSYEEYDFASKNEEEYNLINNFGINYKDYEKYSNDISIIQKTNKNDRKQKVFDYVEKLNISKPKKIMIFKIVGGYSIKDYQNYMFEYVNKLNITKSEKEEIWKRLYEK